MAQIKSLYTGSKHTVISFSGVGNTLQGTNLEFYNLKNHGYNVIWVLDETTSWFNNIDHKEIIKHIKTDKVYAVGNSMGAYNATIFSTLYNVDKVLGFAPQYSVDPTIVPWETRWYRYTKDIKKFKYPHLNFTPWTDYTFISGHKGYETKHMDLIPNNTNINKLVTYGSHDVATKFKESNKLYDVINLYFKEDKAIEQSYLDSLFT
jgi:esterase/lipase|tara:strand:+ start:832 stop:1449 length:618 start_codon:yes stop_codon:yes gene_type:complete